MAEVREVNADLVFAAGARDDAQKGKTHLTPSLSPHPTGGEGERFAAVLDNRPVKSALNEKFGLRRRAIGADAILDGDDAALIFAERRINQTMIFADVAVDDGKIFFLDGAAFENFS